jgi:2',3'-cyclic-nucleotide 2'-phosphodiesterase (5'-nucleotidase family)
VERESRVADFALVVDAGGFSRGSDDNSQLQNEYLITALTWLKFDAINFGYKEFQLKPSFAKKLEQNLQPPFVSANVVLAGSQKTFLQPYLIKEISAQKSERKPAFNKIRVAILGLCDNKLSPLFITRPGEPQLTYLPPIPVAQELVLKLRKKADVVVLLYFGKNDELNNLLQAVPGIDVAILGGEYYMLSSKPADKGRLVFTTPLQGKYVGVVTLQLDKNKQIISSSNKQIPLNEEVAEDPKFAQLVKDFDQANAAAISGSH